MKKTKKNQKQHDAQEESDPFPEKMEGVEVDFFYIEHLWEHVESALEYAVMAAKAAHEEAKLANSKETTLCEYTERLLEDAELLKTMCEKTGDIASRFRQRQETFIDSVVVAYKKNITKDLN